MGFPPAFGVYEWALCRAMKSAGYCPCDPNAAGLRFPSLPGNFTPAIPAGIAGASHKAGDS